jgi:hypothetical protein
MSIHSYGSRLSARYPNMGNINARPPFTRRIDPIQSVPQDSEPESPPSRVRYVEIQLEQGKIGETFHHIVTNCIRKIWDRKASIEYVQVVLEYVHNQVQARKVNELDGESAVRRLVKMANWTNMVDLKNEERIKLDVVKADALQRLSARA